jgi:hypothetical protein
MSYSPDGTRDWSSDLCMFCDHNLGTCEFSKVLADAEVLTYFCHFFCISGCAALWCPCIIYARNKKRIEHLYVEEKVHPKGGGTCSDDCAIHACMSTLCLFGWAIQVSFWGGYFRANFFFTPALPDTKPRRGSQKI